MKRKLTISIGIPAYNEEANIKRLLRKLLVQKAGCYILKEIIVVSDGSTDQTVNEVKSLKRKIIKIITHKKRRGQAYSQGIVFNNAISDVIVLLNADVLPANLSLLKNIAQAFSKNKINGVLAGKVTPLQANNFIESVINHSVQFKTELFENIRGGHNLFLCHGRIRAFSKKFVKLFKWENLLNEDAFSYLVSVRDGYDFVYEPKVEVFYRSPETLTDHLRQSQRFLVSKHELEPFFESKLLSNEYRIPLILFVRLLFWYLIKNPLLTILYGLLSIYSLIINRFSREYSYLFEPSKSSKKLV